MILRSLFFIFIVSYPMSLASASELPKFNIFTEDWSPYQFEKNGVLKGISVDVLEELLVAIGSSQSRKDFKVAPWARGYFFLQHTPHSILFLTTKTKARSSLFKWVGPVFQNSTYLFAKKSRSIKITSVDELSKYRIGSILNDVGEHYLFELGVQEKKLHRASNSINNLQMLNLDRIDMVVDNMENLKANADATGISINNYEPVMILATEDVSYAFHLNTPDWIISRFQIEFDSLVSSGKLDKIYDKYGATRKTAIQSVGTLKIDKDSKADELPTFNSAY